MSFATTYTPRPLSAWATRVVPVNRSQTRRTSGSAVTMLAMRGTRVRFEPMYLIVTGLSSRLPFRKGTGWVPARPPQGEISMDSARLSARLKQPGHDQTFRTSETNFVAALREILDSDQYEVVDHPRDLLTIFASE